MLEEATLLYTFNEAVRVVPIWNTGEVITPVYVWHVHITSHHNVRKASR